MLTNREKIMFILGVLANHVDSKFIQDGVSWEKVKEKFMDDWIKKINMDLDEWNELIAEYNGTTFNEEVLYGFVDELKKIIKVGVDAGQSTKPEVVIDPNEVKTTIE